MIVGVGVDIVDVNRMKRILESSRSRRFLERVFSDEEIRACEATAHPAQGFAARFAAKEALAKALGTGFSRGVTPARIMVQGEERSRPTIALTDKALAVARSMDVGRIHVSLTHTDQSACALVVLEYDRSPGE
ncbi:MAG: holo-[acyl-carrier-protein] synthase [Deltaproteobacteria bacterium]|nr:holo-[acyl-carrier-protein] synthase [Deltaproteobacteria bacterium]